MNTHTSPIAPETIATEAYYHWLNAGQPTGRDQEFWLTAEAALRSQFQAGLKPAPTAATRKRTKARAK